MKKILFITLVVITAAALGSCHKKQVIDPVNDTIPCDTTWWSGSPSLSNDGEVITSPSTSRFPLEEFHQLGQAGDTTAQRKLVDEYRKQLTANVVSHYPGITSHENVHFYLATGHADDVKSGDGNAYSGNFRNELLICINDPAAKDTVFLACGNGMLSSIDFNSFEYYLDFGTAEPWKFTIKKGEGLAHHLPQLQAWGKVATDLKIPIKDKDGKIVSEEIFSNYLGKYESLLFEGDVVDILNGKVYNKLGQEVQFDRRQAETKKANRAAAKAKAKAKKRNKKR